MMAVRERLVMAWTTVGATADTPGSPTHVVRSGSPRTLCGLRWMSAGYNWPPTEQYWPSGVHRCEECERALGISEP
jgi:hypothetical protein